MSARFELRGERGPELIDLPAGSVVLPMLNGFLETLGIDDHEFVWEERGDGDG